MLDDFTLGKIAMALHFLELFRTKLNPSLAVSLVTYIQFYRKISKKLTQMAQKVNIDIYNLLLA